MTKKLRAISWASVSSLPQAAEDKISIDEQLRLNADWCASNHAEIIDTLIIPGHSRYESDLIALLEDYAKQGIWAYHQIREHWQSRDFDIVCCYHDSRFGRSSTTYNYVAENVIRAGARIYRINGGWLDAANAQFGLALGSIAATTGVNQLVQGRKMGMKKRAQRGLPTSSGVPMTHTVIRDDLGNAVKMVVDETKRLMFNDLFRAYVELRTAYRQLEKVMFHQFGHAADTGLAYQTNRFYTLLTNPSTHGHMAQHYRHDTDFAPIGPWIFCDGYPIPDGVTIHYNTHEAVWTGEQFERIFEEFQRRQSLQKRSGGDRAHAFTGLLVCGECGYSLLYQNGKYASGLRCMSHYNVSPTRPDCTQNKWIHIKKIRAWFTPRLEQLIADHDWNTFFDIPSNGHDGGELQAVEAEIARINAQIIRMIEDQSRQDSPAVIQLYEDKIKAAGERLDILNTRLDELKLQDATTQHTTHQREYTLNEIAQMGLSAFWKLPNGEINQMLHRLMGRRRLEVLDAQIIATREARPYRRRKKIR